MRFKPLASEQVAAINSQRARPQNRVLFASQNGAWYFNRGGGIAVHTRKDIWTRVEKYRYSDAKPVTWTVDYSHTTNWPS